MAMIVCPHCGEQVSEKAKKCVHCGEILILEEKKHCTECGVELEEGMTECPNCGCPVDDTIGQETDEKPQKVGKGAYAIHQSGKWYTDDNIDQMLMERHLNKKARRSSNKNHFKGTKKRTEEDDVRFAQSFEKLLLMAQERRESE